MTRFAGSPWICGLCVMAAGCADDGRPPFADDGVEEQGETHDDGVDPSTGESLIPDTEDEDAVACDGVSVELSILRPNFYFLLDASESMQEVMPNSGGMTRHLAARRAILDMLRAVGHRVNFGAALFPNPDTDNGCAAGREVFSVRPGEPLLENGSDNAQLDALAFTLRKYSPSGATPVAATLEAVLPDLVSLETDSMVFLLTDGAPNCDLEEPCTADACIPNIEGAEFEGFPKCDSAFNCCTPDLLPHLCLDEDDTVEQLQHFSANGIRTYVIGIPGSEVYADVLNAMANAAGTEKGEDTDYYPVEDADSLALTLADLGQQLSASCEFELGATPERSTLVRVLADKEELALDDPDGWEWTSEASIALLGDACSSWRSADFTRLRVVESCRVDSR